jgi:hypothetical protein
MPDQVLEEEALARFVREHHVHFEVAPELVAEGPEPEVVGFQVRLFATHEESKLERPGCPRCVELAKELRAFAEQLVAGDLAKRTEFAPQSPALYQSTEVPGADEVALALRVRCNAPEHRQAGDDRCIVRLRDRLQELGVPQR